MILIIMIDLGPLITEHYGPRFGINSEFWITYCGFQIYKVNDVDDELPVIDVRTLLGNKLGVIGKLNVVDLIIIERAFDLGFWLMHTQNGWVDIVDKFVWCLNDADNEVKVIKGDQILFVERAKLLELLVDDA